MFTQFVRTGLMLSLAASLVACGSQAATVPTAVPTAPPTAVPTPPPTAVPTAEPTAVPTAEPTVVPTAEPTAVPSTAAVVTDLPPITDSTEAAAILANAVERTLAITSYTAQFEIVSQGLTLGMPAELLDDPDQPLVLLRGSTTVNGDDNELIQSGLLGAMFSDDPSSSMIFRTVDGQRYLRGPQPILGAPEDAWYIQPTDGGGLTMEFNLLRLLADLGQSEADFAEFWEVGGGSLSGNACKIFLADDASTQRFIAAGGPFTPAPDEFAGGARLLVTTCDDGFIYDVELKMQGAGTQTALPAQFILELELRQFNQPLTIDVPADARPLEL
jgi:hypothetical protein